MSSLLAAHLKADPVWRCFKLLHDIGQSEVPDSSCDIWWHAVQLFVSCVFASKNMNIN